jgi:hypothetical protein
MKAIATMNAPAEEMVTIHQDSSVAASRGIRTRIFGSCEVLLCTDTCQFDDYSKYVSTCWDPEVKAKRRKEIFPQDCRRSYELGVRLAAAALCS